ncbi:MAG TPA: TolC family protein, partial [Calditrichia bacterium]|nr:TolC family protein [Calditrichia bacterium]
MRHYLIYLLCLLASSGLLAREYDLQEMIRLAESGNKEIRLAKADLKAASAEKLDAFSQALPKINVVGNYNRNLQENVLYFTQDFATGATLDEPIKIPIS